MNRVAISKFTGLIVLFAVLQVSMFAQGKNDAIKAFNEGVQMMKADPVSAIGAFENCISICEQVGDSANAIKEKAAKVLPDLYYQKASDLLLMDKKIDESLKASKTALAVAKKYDSPKTVENTQLIMIQAYSAKGSALFAGNEADKAIQVYDSALMINPDHQASIYNKAMIYRKLNNSPKFGETIDLYISKLKPGEDDAKIGQAKKVAVDYFRIAGGKANQANKMADALSLLNTASKYGEDRDVYYQFANIYNKQKKFTEAAVNAQKGLDMETGTPEAKAKFYYELAVSQVGKGETANACETFKNSMYGPFLQASKAQRTNLKCK
jgi:tetratricopeptide (TPR) repeat protein